MGIRRSAALIASLVLVVGGCGSDDGGDDGTGGSGTTKIRYLTSFNAFGREAYAYVAQEKGYFKDAGFDVTITPGTGTVDVLKLIAGGQADFGIGDFNATLLTTAKQKLDVTTVAMIHQRSMAAIIALEDSGIKTAQDLPGKTIGDQPGSTNQLMFPLFAAASGFDPNKVKFVPGAPPALPQLLVSGKVDGIGQFVVGKPLIEKAANGKKAVVVPYGDKLPDLYGNGLVTTAEHAKNDQDMVKKFSAALLKGLDYAIQNPEEAGQILKKYQPTQDAQVAAAELMLMKPYVQPDGFAGPLGAIDQLRVDKIIKILTDAKAVPAGSLTSTTVVDFGLVPKT